MQHGRRYTAARWSPRGIHVFCSLPSGWIRHMRHWPGPDYRWRHADLACRRTVKRSRRRFHIWGSNPYVGPVPTRRKPKKDKGGARAIAEAVRLLRSGTAVCITPDGPRGPAEQVSPGAILIAQRAEVPILPYALAARPVIRLNSWDRFIIAFPFSTRRHRVRRPGSHLP